MKYLNKFLIGVALMCFASVNAQNAALGYYKPLDVKPGLGTVALATSENFKWLEVKPEWVAANYWGGARINKEGSFCFPSGLLSQKDNNSWGKTLVTLPDGFKPAKHLVFCAGESDSAEGYAQVDVLPSGDINWVALGKANWIPLNSIYFSVVEGDALTLKTGVTNFGADQGNATVKKEGNIVMVSGSVKTTLTAADDKGIVLAELPAGSRPLATMVFNCIYNDGAVKKGNLEVTKDGIITLKVAKGTVLAWVSLSNILFSLVDGTPLQLEAGFTNAPGYAPATSQKIGTSIVLLQGSVNGPLANNKTLAKFSADFAPSGNSITSGASDTMNAGRVDVYTNFLHLYGKYSAANKVLHLNGIVYPFAISNDILDSANGATGGTSYVNFGGSLLKFNESWKIGLPGNGWVKFKANAVRDLYVAFSTLPLSFDGPTRGAGYIFWLGQNWNLTSGITKYSNYAWIYADPDTKKNIYLKATNVNAGGNPNAIVSAGKLEDYWFQVKDGVVSWGKGTEVGKNEMMTWTDPEPLGFVQYVCLGGAPGLRIEFKDIQFSTIPVVEIPINLPANFEAEPCLVQEAGKAEEVVKFARITVGSYNNELEAWGLREIKNEKGEVTATELYTYLPYSMKPSAWEKKEFKNDAGVVFKFEDISCASDGTLVGILVDGKGMIYNRTTSKWEVLNPGKDHADLDLDLISAGSKNSIWAVDTDANEIYMWTADGWVAPKDSKGNEENDGNFVAVGVDGTVVALNAAGASYSFDKGRWMQMPGVNLEKVAVADKTHIIGSTKDNALWEYKDGKWVAMLGADGKPATGLDEISINAAGTIFALDEDGDQYINGEAAVVVTLPTPDEVKRYINDEVKLNKLAPSELEVQKKLIKVTPAKKPAAKETRGDAKKTGKVKKAVIKKKTSGKGKAAKKVAAVKKKVTKAKKPGAEVKAKTKATKKAAKKTVKKSAKKATKKVAKAAPAKKTAKKVTAKTPTAKKAAPKKAAAKKPAAKKSADKKEEAPAAPAPAPAA